MSSSEIETIVTTGDSKYLRRVIFYLLSLLTFSIWFAAFLVENKLYPILQINPLFIKCIISGLIGGITYCLKGVYYNRCVRKKWDSIWVTWYCIRPIVSAIMGGMIYFVIKIGLITIGTNQDTESVAIFYVIAFFAGYNVDGFLKKLEIQVSTKIGVKNSRQSEE